MRPTLNQDPAAIRDVVLVRRAKPPRKEADLGQIVCLRHPKDEQRLLIKRITGLEGQIKGAREVVVPKENCFVESDAAPGRLMFSDSNLFGPVPVSSIVGVATHVVFPPWRMRRLL
jgi:signal peptidase I